MKTEKALKKEIRNMMTVSVIEADSYFFKFAWISICVCEHWTHR